MYPNIVNLKRRIIKMGLYAKYILPKVINSTCSTKPIMKQREKVLPLCNGVVLEVGAGSGLNFSFYNPDKVSMVYALEPDPEMLKQARTQAQKVKLSFSFLQAGAEQIPLEDNMIDTVLLTFTLCTIPKPDLALKEMRRVLKNSGKLIFCEHGIAPDKKVQQKQNILNLFWPYLSGGCNLNRDIPKLIEENGFKFENVETMYLPGTAHWAGFNFWGSAN